jgi:2-hydroxy-3-keto-5-methylthiopentenyl-1-phosphate phosphatase
MNAGKKNQRILVLCDFDGTICTVDMGNKILNRFTGEGWDEIDRAYCADEIGSRDAYTQVASLFRGTRSQMLEYVSNYERLDPHFSDFYQFCRINIDAILRKHNLQDIEFFSNVVVFPDSNTLSIEFPRINNQCEKCGTCKNSVLKQYRLEYDRVIYVGNGHSDVCPAKDADLVFAKDVLYEKCVQNGTSCIHYENFGDIREYLTVSLHLRTE